MLAMEMKTSGMYLARELSFREAEVSKETIDHNNNNNNEISFQFAFLEVDLSDEQICIYNVASHIWQDRLGCLIIKDVELIFSLLRRDELRKSLDHAQARTESSARLGSIYWGAHQRFFKQLWYL